MTEPDDLPVAGTAVLLRATAQGFEVLLMRRPDRGSFSGAWVFPGGKVEQRDRRDGDDEQDDARRAAVRETFEEVGLVITDPVVVSRWQPPVGAPVRIRTWFFLANALDAPQGALQVSADEVVDATWITPADALRKHAAGEWMLFPPTWVTLHQLSRFGNPGEALSAGGVARHFSTRIVESDLGTAFEWEGLRLETGSLPWRIVSS
ncbi:NUDIX domain-containing protein [Microbacterium sp. WCS2018Hpa-23]|uniref:NUDIX hydrolase n=1 Tax=Microbacterium sp. WCS2018Hpa-23 TaxID=3073634 RepID=UPI0028834F61|nr:NUDIX domain-containing protein [Microbacterium sp. WCS2018Hpa-23]